MDSLYDEVSELTNKIETVVAQMQHQLNQDGKTARGQARIKDLKVLYDFYVKMRSNLEAFLQN